MRKQSMCQKPIRFGILGCGMIAQIHAAAINSLESAILAGAADQDSFNAIRFSKQYGITPYSNYSQMLSDPNIDAVCICTPSGFHAENAIQALRSKKHVVLEKPMATTVADTERIISACQENSRILTVISQLRFSPETTLVKNLISQQAFGTVSFCNLSMNYWRDPEYYSSSKWKGTQKFDGGGALMNQGIHGVDLLLYIAGNAKVLSSRKQTSFHSIEVEDTAAALLAFENGALGTLSASTCTYPGFDRKIEILGSSGCAILRDGNLEKLIVNGETHQDLSRLSTVGTAGTPSGLSHHGHILQISNFINAIYGKEPLLVDPFQGQRAVKLIEAIYSNS